VGRYVVDAVPEGTVAVTASVGTQSLAGTNSGRLLGDGSVLVLDVALRGSGSLSGFLRRPGGTLAGPVSRVTLQAGGQGGGMQTTVSAEDGQFGFGEVPAGTVSLRADVLGGEDFATGSADVPSGGAVTGLILTLHGSGEVVVEVQDASGATVAD